jgi:hypothetical protein
MRLAGERRALALAAMVAPGFLAGLHLGGLLFFLNPDLPFAGLPVARTVLLYGLLGGAASAVVLSPLAWRRPRRALRSLPWWVTGALAAAALLDFLHASYYAYYLPPGINDRLLKTALWLSLAALITFYTTLLHSLHRRRYGPRSRLAFWLLAVASVVVMVERRGAFTPKVEIARASGFEPTPRPALLVVGVETATLDAILPMAEEGRLPFLASLLRDGAYGRLGAFAPNRPPALWTTLSTGKYPFEHGVLGGRVHPAPFVAPGAALRLLPRGIGFARWGTFGLPSRPEDRGRVRRVRTLWEVLPRLGVSSGVVGWPAIALGGEREGEAGQTGPDFAFADRFFAGTLDPSAGRPEILTQRAWIFRVEAGDLDPRHLGGFADDAPEAVLSSLAEDVWRQSVARFLLDERDTRSVFVRLPGLETAAAAFFGGYAELRFEGRHDPEFEHAAAALTSYYAGIDTLVAELWAALDPPRLLAVVSPSGVDTPSDLDRAWLAARGRQPVHGALDGAADGVLFLGGEGVRPGTLVTGAELVDVAPTLLYALGLPVARDLDGRLLTEAFTAEFLDAHPLTFVPSYETLASRPR